MIMCSLHVLTAAIVLLFYFIYVKTTTTTTTTILYSMYILVRVVSENRDVLAVVACAANSHYKSQGPEQLIPQASIYDTYIFGVTRRASTG